MHSGRCAPHQSKCALEPTNHLDDARVGDACWLKDQDSMSNVVAHVDGGSLGNPGPSGIGVVLHRSEGPTIRIAKWIGHQDNNVAEYVALLEALQRVLTLKAGKLHVYSDSQVVVRQMNGEYICRSPRLYSLHWICRKLARSLDFSISHVRREHNTEANGLANSAVRKNLSRPSSAHQISLRDAEVILPEGRSRRSICDLQLPPTVSSEDGHFPS
jgi:ribonuclease HI